MGQNLIRTIIYAQTKLVIHHRPDVDPTTDVMENCDYNFMSQSEGARVADTELSAWGVKESRPLLDHENDPELDGRL